jgi:hypothetical protein
VVHELAPGLTPSAADIRNALKVGTSIDIDAGWDDLAERINQGKPLALSETRYSRGLDECLARLGVVIESEPDFASRLRGWLKFRVEAEAS